MGGKSTSHSAVLSGQKTSSSSSFDLHSWQGLTEVLRIGKEALRDADAYADFRNLVLEYAQRGGDIELRKKIDGIITSFSAAPATTVQSTVTPVPEVAIKEEPIKIEITEHSKVQTPSGIGTRRIQPRFEVSEKANLSSPVSEQVVEIPRPVEDIAIEPPSVTASESLVQDTVTASIKASESVPEPVVEIPVVYKSVDEYKDRILQIKRSVNSHFGNPAMLVNMSNDLGKKYMTALLTALKATSAGSTIDVDSAMMRLEEDSKNLLLSLTPHAVPNSEMSVPIIPEPIVVPPVAHIEIEKSEEKAIPVVFTPPTPVVEEKPIEDIQPEEKADTAFVFQKSNEAIASVLEKTQQNTHSAASTLATLLMHDEDRGSHETLRESSVLEPEPVPTSGGTTASELRQSKHAIRGVAASHPDIIKDRSGVDSAFVAVQQSELVSPENTKALHNLLHEWNVFSGSGLFGIGPSGSEHPLYIRLAPLSMGEVIAGRWEGSNPKTQRIIKEYVDAWRHEQGVAYTIQETFEHYLRRVVQRILKRQNP